jgi:predicted transposase/invertase (TIGR01784 family)
MYDNTCKFLAENFSTDFASWLLGKAIPLTKIEPSELSLEPIRADSVIFLESSKIVLHIEFQTATDETMAYRMANYWLRLYAKYPNKEIYQVVIYLKRTNSPLAHQTSFRSKQLNHEFNVIRLWEQPTEIFQQYLGLLPLAVLSKTNNPEATLRHVARQIENIADKRLQSSVTASTAIISGIALDKSIIQRLLRSEIMKESVIYQDILLEGKALGQAIGMAEGKAEGKAETTRQLTLNMLRSGIAVDLITQITGLTLKQVQKLEKTAAKQPKNVSSSPKQTKAVNSSKNKRSPKP